MRHRAVPAATLIVAAGLIGITGGGRLTRPVKDYHDRVTAEMSAIALHDTIASWPWGTLKHAMRLVDVAIMTA